MSFKIQFDRSFNRRTLIIAGGSLLLLIAAILGLVLVLNRDSEPQQAELPPVATSTQVVVPTPSLLPVVPSEAEAPANTPEPAATATLQPYEHVVQEGETLFFIIQLFGYRDTSVVPEILLLNGLASENGIFSGQTLLIPRQTPTPGAVAEVAELEEQPAAEQPAETQPEAAEEAESAIAEESQEAECSPDDPCISGDGQYWVHVVREGNTIAGIAFAYDSRVPDILQVNGLPQNPIIQLGQEILVPILITPTPTLTPTGGPDSTATPTPTLSPPPLIAPVDGAEIARNDQVALQWAAVRRLNSNENYLVEVRDISNGEVVYASTTRSTANLLPESLRPGIGGTRQYSWRVVIVSGNSPQSPLTSGEGESWSFTWGN